MVAGQKSEITNPLLEERLNSVYSFDEINIHFQYNQNQEPKKETAIAQIGLNMLVVTNVYPSRNNLFTFDRNFSCKISGRVGGFTLGFSNRLTGTAGIQDFKIVGLTAKEKIDFLGWLSKCLGGNGVDKFFINILNEQELNNLGLNRIRDDYPDGVIPVADFLRLVDNLSIDDLDQKSEHHKLNFRDSDSSIGLKMPNLVLPPISNQDLAKTSFEQKQIWINKMVVKGMSGLGNNNEGLPKDLTFQQIWSTLDSKQRSKIHVKYVLFDSNFKLISVCDERPSSNGKNRHIKLVIEELQQQPKPKFEIQNNSQTYKIGREEILPGTNQKIQFLEQQNGVDCGVCCAINVGTFFGGNLPVSHNFNNSKQVIASYRQRFYDLRVTNNQSPDRNSFWFTNNEITNILREILPSNYTLGMPDGTKYHHRVRLNANTTASIYSEQIQKAEENNDFRTLNKFLLGSNPDDTISSEYIDKYEGFILGYQQNHWNAVVKKDNIWYKLDSLYDPKIERLTKSQVYDLLTQHRVWIKIEKPNNTSGSKLNFY